MKTRIILIGLILIACVALYAGERRANRDTMTPQMALDKGWEVFEQYLKAAKAHDLPTITSLSYQLSDTCKNPELIKDCYKLMDTVYYFGSDIKKESMTHIAYDKKQIQLSSEETLSLEGDMPAASRVVIYFVREGDAVKILSFDPFYGTFIYRNGQATSTVEARLKEMTFDTDGDLLSDKQENCENASSGPDCVKTNPKNKDSDRDGWWDSTEALFNPNR